MSSTGMVNYPIHINSKDRINQQDPTNTVTVTIKDLINERARKKIFLTLNYASIPPTVYNVTSRNNTVIVNEDTIPSTAVVTYTATIPAGNYNISTFITALSGAMTAQSASAGYSNVYTGTYDTVTGQLTISIIGSPANRNFTYTFFNSNNCLMSFMGFSPEWENITVVQPSPNFYEFASFDPVNFVVQTSIYLRCSIWKNDSGYNTSDSAGATNILGIIPIFSNGFSQIVYDLGNQGIPDRKIELSNVLNQNITFTLTDQNNVLIDLNNYDWQLVLMLQYEK